MYDYNLLHCYVCAPPQALPSSYYFSQQYHYLTHITSWIIFLLLPIPYKFLSQPTLSYTPPSTVIQFQPLSISPTRKLLTTDPTIRQPQGPQLPPRDLKPGTAREFSPVINLETLPRELQEVM